MRTDEKVDIEKKNQMQSMDATSDGSTATVNLGESIRKQVENGASFSGGESNHMWVSMGGQDFMDISGISGTSHGGDSRSFALFDYDKDGFQDMVVVNANAPYVKLFRNRIGEHQKETSAGSFIAVRFEGGNQSATPSKEFAPRDGYGAKLRVKVGEQILLRELRCGEGLAAQNSTTLMVGLGQGVSAADSIEVTWPSGRSFSLDKKVAAGSLVTCSEKTGSFKVQKYGKTKKNLSAASHENGHKTSKKGSVMEIVGETGHGADHRMYVLSYPTCSACKKAIPRLERIAEEYGSEMAMYAVPYGSMPGTKAEWYRYVKKYDPAYEPLVDMTPEQLAVMESNLAAMGVGQLLAGCGRGEYCVCETPCGTEPKGYGAPTTLVTDSDGNPIAAFSGVPSVSELRKTLHH
ncbi:MAG: ASPIC/UnbV domain-containing protein [Planctomycetota bacterium]|nr:ASPIC/UnbV domain-containing protein [Planctomycetota bacterium]MDP6941357.1 ASPIC/UnbV domain-containing protein [Planctomycetota bacterium]